MQNPDILKDEAADKLTTGGLYIIQKNRGYRFSIDSYLLAAFVDEPEGTPAVEIGSGSGVVSILLAGVKNIGMTGVEVQPALAEMSKRSVVMNRLEKKLRIINADIKDYTSAGFNAVVVNPPYRPVGSGRINPHDEKAVARHEIMLTLEQMFSCTNRLLNDGGRFYSIYPVWRLPDMLSVMRNNNIEPKKIVMVHSHARSRASLFLVKGIKGSGRELFVEPPLFVREARNEYTARMKDLFRTLSIT